MTSKSPWPRCDGDVLLPDDRPGRARGPGQPRPPRRPAPRRLSARAAPVGVGCAQAALPRGEPVRCPSPRSPLPWSFSPDGRLVAAAGGALGEPGFVAIWDADSGREVRSFRGHDDAITGLAFDPAGRSPGDRRVATGRSGSGTRPPAGRSASSAATPAAPRASRSAPTGDWSPRPARTESSGSGMSTRGPSGGRSPATPRASGPSPSAPTAGCSPRAAAIRRSGSGTCRLASGSGPSSATRGSSTASPSAPTDGSSPRPVMTARRGSGTRPRARAGRIPRTLPVRDRCGLQPGWRYVASSSVDGTVMVWEAGSGEVGPHAPGPHGRHLGRRFQPRWLADRLRRRGSDRQALGASGPGAGRGPAREPAADPQGRTSAPTAGGSPSCAANRLRFSDRGGLGHADGARISSHSRRGPSGAIRPESRRRPHRRPKIERSPTSVVRVWWPPMAGSEMVARQPLVTRLGNGLQPRRPAAGDRRAARRRPDLGHDERPQVKLRAEQSDRTAGSGSKPRRARSSSIPTAVAWRCSRPDEIDPSGQALTFFDAATGEARLTIRGATAPLAFSRDGRRLIALDPENGAS